MAVFYKIAIDRVAENYISGWCYHRFNETNVVELCLSRNGKVVGEAKANIFREDLKELGVHPTGRCGFELIIDTPVEHSEEDDYIISVKHSTRPLVKIDRMSTRQTMKDIVESVRTLLNPTFRMTPRIVFMHIPKTAGTSFNTQIQSILPARRVAIHVELENSDRYHHLLKTKSYLSGHFRLGLLKKHFTGHDSKFYTIIREPYAHLHSHLNWMIKTAHDEKDNYFKYSNKVIYNLGKKLASIDFGTISAIRDFVDNLDTVETQFFDNLQTRYFCTEQIERVDTDDCHQAIKNSREFSLIGTTEHYGDFLRQFVSMNNMPRIKKTGQLNRSKAAPLFDQSNFEVREVLYPLVCHDILLYNHICGEYETGGPAQ